MGVPSFYRWLSRKYPKIIRDVIEEDSVIDGVEVPADPSLPNPNGEEVIWAIMTISIVDVVHRSSHRCDDRIDL